MQLSLTSPDWRCTHRHYRQYEEDLHWGHNRCTIFVLRYGGGAIVKKTQKHKSMAHWSEKCRITGYSVVFGILCTKIAWGKRLKHWCNTGRVHGFFKSFKSPVFDSGLRTFYRGLWLEAQKCKHCVVFLGLEKVFIITTVAILVEDLWRHWSPLLWLSVFGDVVVHPQSLFLQHCDVYLLKVDPVGLEKAYHVLLVLFYRDRATWRGDVNLDYHFIPCQSAILFCLFVQNNFTRLNLCQRSTDASRIFKLNPD